MPTSMRRARLMAESQRLSSKVGQFEREHKALNPCMKPAHLAQIDKLKEQLEAIGRQLTSMQWTM